MLRQRYEQIRERALRQTTTAIGSDMAMGQGMRSWIEIGGPQEVVREAATFQHETGQHNRVFQQMAAVWASVFVSQAERRSYSGREA
jgi:hypothetical protein